MIRRIIGSVATSRVTLTLFVIVGFLAVGASFKLVHEARLYRGNEHPEILHTAGGVCGVLMWWCCYRLFQVRKKPTRIDCVHVMSSCLLAMFCMSITLPVKATYHGNVLVNWYLPWYGTCAAVVLGVLGLRLALLDQRWFDNS